MHGLQLDCRLGLALPLARTETGLFVGNLAQAFHAAATPTVWVNPDDCQGRGSHFETVSVSAFRQSVRRPVTLNARTAHDCFP